MRRKFRAWRIRRRFPTIEFGQTVKVKAGGSHYLMRLTHVEVSYHDGATATLRPLSDWAEIKRP